MQPRPWPVPGAAGLHRAVTLIAMLGVALLTAACDRAMDAESAFARGDYDTALNAWRVRALAGDAYAQNYVGVHYQLGLGIGKDPGRALLWFTHAARAGNTDAQRNLGTLYYRGLGVEQDKVLAYGWVAHSAKQGNAVADAMMAAMTDEVTPNQMRVARDRVRAQLQHAGTLADIPDVPTLARQLQ